jgi:hypothetical protein
VSALVPSLVAGFRSIRGNPGLVLLVLATNLALALVLAVPFADTLERDLAHTGASRSMMYGFDYDWWARFDPTASGPAASFAPDILGTGFALRNLDLLLRGVIPAGLFASEKGPDAAILGMGVLYLVLQVFLTGGLLGVFRAPAGGWTFRSLVHGSGFYFGRLLRVSLLALAAASLVFAANGPLARWVDRLATEAVSERTALALTLGRWALLLVLLVLVHMVSSHAKVLVVREERLSAVLAFASSAAFCARRLVSALGQYVVVFVLAALLLGGFGFVDRHLTVTGFRTQLAAFLLFEAFVGARVALRLGLLASQLELQERFRR